MPHYLMQKRIHTLLNHDVFNESGRTPFIRSGVCFSSWDRDSPWNCRFWLAESEIDSHHFSEAWTGFQEALTRVTSRIAFVGQAYHSDLGQPYLIRRSGAEIAYFRHSRDRSPVPLTFAEGELSSLDNLLGDTQIPDAFYLYWNDAINAMGYSAKLVLIFAALESLFGKASRSRSNVEFYATIDEVFGPELKKQLYGTPEDKGKSGLRQRLVHGEHLSETDTMNYVEIIHRQIVKHFNTGVLSVNPIT